ncbi:hypothetical protein LMG28614_00172 [Paraburkholderia ultramafica]|uniref:Uncharacterized protein n=1 Tax=Paraburkholderia ultramafica TaxID=1544867 RepID=A0A6S7BXJ2_9BURK|nr:hypothetical protein [Paraburkholderia ultramafica]CAB3776228.1 hypothetical protein LMG28614_00172 [Paraburkholderia ultramafica]
MVMLDKRRHLETVQTVFGQGEWLTEGRIGAHDIMASDNARAEGDRRATTRAASSGCRNRDPIKPPLGRPVRRHRANPDVIIRHAAGNA